MVQWGKQERILRIPEWKNQYLDYKKLKKILNKLNSPKKSRQGTSIIFEPVNIFQHKTNLDPKICNDWAPKMEKEEEEKQMKQMKQTQTLSTTEKLVEANSILFSNNDIELDENFDDLHFKQCELTQFISFIKSTINLKHKSYDDNDKQQIFDIERKFLMELQQEINKVSKFYSELIIYFAQSIQRLLDRLKYLHHKNEILSKGKVKELKKLFRTTYLGVADKLSAYRIVNVTSVSKICKKHDKRSSYKHLQNKVLEIIEQNGFFGNNHSEQYLINRMEMAFAHFFSSKKKMKISEVSQELRRIPNLNQQRIGINSDNSRSPIFYIGFYLGCIMSMIMSCCIYLLIESNDIDINNKHSFWKSEITQRFWNLFSISICSCLYSWLWAWNLRIFEKKRFNHSFIFQLDPYSSLKSDHVFIFASIITFFTFIIIHGYVFAFVFENNSSIFINSIPLYWYNMILTIFWIIIIIYPGKRYLKARSYLFSTIFNIIISPFVSVRFIDFFVADQLTSLFIIILNISYSLCLFITGEWKYGHLDPINSCNTNTTILVINILKILPFWWRFAQCMRRYYDDSNHIDHLINAGKYASSIVTVFVISIQSYYSESNTLFMLRLLFGIISTIYAYLWDIYKDWGLGHRQYKFLRKELTFSIPIYYLAIIFDLLFRISWAVALFPSAFNITFDFHYFGLVFALIEIIRRCCWNVLRLENEHKNNCGNFRVVLEIPKMIVV